MFSSTFLHFLMSFSCFFSVCFRYRGHFTRIRKLVIFDQIIYVIREIWRFPSCFANLKRKILVIYVTFDLLFYSLFLSKILFVIFLKYFNAANSIFAFHPPVNRNVINFMGVNMHTMANMLFQESIRNFHWSVLANFSERLSVLIFFFLFFSRHFR